MQPPATTISHPGEALRLVAGSAAAVTALRGVEALGPLRGVVLGMLPLDAMSRMQPAVALSDDDRQVCQVVRVRVGLSSCVLQVTALGPLRGVVLGVLPSVSLGCMKR